MKKKLLSVLLCLCMVMALLPTTALAAEGDPTPTPTQNEISNFEQLQAAFSNTGGEYTLAADITVTKNLQWTSNERLTIHGNRHTITYDSQSATITNNGNLTIKNLTINGNQKGGRCISNNAGTLNMEKVTLKGASLSGGFDTTLGAGLYNAADATAILTDCNIRNNINSGNASGTGYGGGFYNAGTLIMENCAIVENKSSGKGYAHGGGGYNCGTLYMNNCTVANNQSGREGGGIYQTVSGAKTYLMNCTVTGNLTGAYSGGISTNGGSLYAVNSVFAFNYKNESNSPSYDINGSASLYSCAYNGDTKLDIQNKPESVAALFNAAESVTVEYNVYCRPVVTAFKKDGFTSYGVYLKDDSALLTGGTATYYERNDSTVKMSYGAEKTALGGLTAAGNECAVTTYQDGTTRAVGVIGALSSPPPHKHALCQTVDCTQDHEGHTEVTFTAWDANANVNFQTSLPGTAGNYYLTKDVELTSTWKPADGTVLCLNGHSITMNQSVSTSTDVISVGSGVTFTLTDCQSTPGTITHNYSESNQKTGRGVYVDGGTFNMYGGTISNHQINTGAGVYMSSGTFNMYDGSITGNTATYGGGVYVVKGGNFTMTGGQITGNTAINFGGGVYMDDGTFTMTGGSITGNEVKWNGGGGGGVYSSGTFTMSGGTIGGADNAANEAAYGGGVCVRNGEFRMTGGSITGNTASSGGGVCVWPSNTPKFIMSGGSITGNTATNFGGGVYVVSKGTFEMNGGTIGGTNENAANEATYGGGVYVNGGTFEMSGGSITGNKATENGGGVYITDGTATFTMSGGTISGNETASSYGGGVYVNIVGNGTFKVSGSPKITDNNYKGASGDATINNVYLPSGKRITITGELDEAAQIGVTKYGDTGVFTSGWGTYMSDKTPGDYFESDAGLDIKEQNGELYLVPPHTHGNWDYSVSDDGKTITATCNAGGTCPFDYTETLTISASDATYDGSSKTATLSDNKDLISGLKDISATYKKYVDDTWTNFDGTPTDAGKYKASITVGTEESAVTASAEYTIAKADGSLTAPTAKTGLVYNGSALELIKAGSSSGTGTVQYKLGDGDYGTGIPTATNAGTYTVYYKLVGDANHNDVTGDSQKVTVKIAKANPSVNAPTAKTPTYTGSDQELINAGSTTGGTMQYSLDNSNWGTEIPKGNAAGDYTVYYKVVGDDNYNGVESGSISVTIAKANPTVTAPTAKTLTYTGSAQELVNAGSAINGTMKYSLDNSNWGTEIPKGNAAGDYTVYYKVVGNTNYSDTAQQNFTVTIAKANPTVNAPTAKTLTYTGSAQELVNAGSAINGTMKYSLDNSSWSDSIPQGTDATEYTVYYKVVGNANYSDTAVQSVAVSIAKADGSLTAPTAKTGLVYNGSALELISAGSSSGTGTVQYKLGDGDYGTGIPTATNAGTYTVYYKLVGDANHNDVTGDSLKLDVTIGKATLTVAGTASAAAVYGTQVKNISITGLTVKFGDNTIEGIWKFPSDNTTVPNVTAPGTYTATFTPDSVPGNYNTLTQDVTPTISKVNPTTPTALTGTQGNALSTVTLPSGWAWDNGDTVMTETGDKTFQASYTDSTGNYNNASNVNVTVNVSSKTNVSGSITFENGELTYTGTGLDYKTATITGVSGGTWTYTYAAGSSSASLDGSGKPLAVGTYTVTATYEDSTHFGTKSATLTVIPKTVTAPAADTTVFTYNGNEQTYTLTANAAYTVTGNVKTAAGTYNVTVALADTTNTKWNDDTTADKTYTFTINKATPTGDPTYTAITTSGKTLADAALTKNAGWPEGGTLKWVQADGTTELDSSTVVVANTSYKWLYTPADTTNHNTLTGSITPYVVSYSGGSYTPPTYKVESEVTESTDGNVSFSKGSAKKGDTVTITVTPDRYYKVDSVTVKDKNGNEIDVIDNGDGTFSFKMPASEVAVEPTFSWDNPFTDVAEDTYYTPAVEWALKNDITNGAGDDTTFGPDAECTRAQIVTFLWRAAGCPEPAGLSSFADVSADAYYAKAVAWAVEQGITNGTGDGTTFSPDATCTRSQGVTFLYRSAGSPVVSDDIAFNDVTTGSYYSDAVVWATQNGVTDGTGNSKFSPAKDCTRAQIVTFLYRWMVK